MDRYKIKLDCLLYDTSNHQSQGGRNFSISVKETDLGEERTCVVIVSEKLKQGQIQGICQNLKKKYKLLDKFKQ